MRIGVIVAMDKEFAQLQTLASDKKEQTVAGRTFVVGRIGENEIVMQKCGIGKVNAAVGASEMIAAFHPDLVISTGVAGGADTSLEVCEVVVSTACCYHDVYCGDECAMCQVLGMPEGHIAQLPHAGSRRTHRHRRLVCQLSREDAADSRQLPNGNGCRHGELFYSADLPYL